MLGLLCLHGNSPWVKCLWMIRGPWWSKLSMKQMPSWAIFVCVKISESFPLRFRAQFTSVGFSWFSLVTTVLLIFVLSIALAFCKFLCFCFQTVLWWLWKAARSCLRSDCSPSDILFSAELQIDKHAFNITSGYEASQFLKSFLEYN